MQLLEFSVKFCSLSPFPPVLQLLSWFSYTFCPLRASKHPPRVPKSGQRAPKDATWDPQRYQREAKGSLGEAKGSPRVSTGTPRTPIGLPNDLQKYSKMTPKSVQKWDPGTEPPKNIQNCHFLVARGVKNIKNTRVLHRCPMGPKGVKIAKTHEKTSIF